MISTAWALACLQAFRQKLDLILIWPLAALTCPLYASIALEGPRSASRLQLLMALNLASKTRIALRMSFKSISVFFGPGRWRSLLTVGETESAEGRARERQRRIVLQALASALAKAISVGTALISVPLSLHYLGTERFGMWMTMSSLVALLSFADLGIGNGLLSSVAAAHGRDDRKKIRELVSSAYFALGLIAVMVLAFFALAYAFVPWHRVFNVQSELARAEAGPSIAVMVTCFALAIPIGVVQRTQLGLQMGYASSLWQCVASLLGLAGVMSAIWQEAPLPLLLMAYAGAPLLVGLVNSLVFFLYQQRDLAPYFGDVSRAGIRILAGTGLLFLVLQVAGSLTFMSDSFIIAQKLGAAAVSQYAVPEKLFGLIGMIIGFALSPLWPAYGEAIARGDVKWVRATLRSSLLISAAVAATGSGILIVAAPWIIKLWVGHAVAPPLLLLLGLGIWRVCDGVGNSLAMFLNGARVVRLQVAISLITAVVAVSLKFYFVEAIGAAGVIWATIISYFILTIFPYFLLLGHLMRKISSGSIDGDARPQWSVFFFPRFILIRKVRYQRG